MEIYIGIPCYRVASSIKGVLDRVYVARPDVHVILINDGSPDNLDEIVAGLDQKRFKSFTYHKHPQNRGYGGAQKTIYKLFLSLSRDPMDMLIQLHGDGQTAEDEIGHFISTAERYPRLDVVLGSRMLNPLWTQIKAGRPLYKVLADYVLTIIQNQAYNLTVSTYTSGSRLFRRRGLSKIDFSKTDDGHAFDTESLILYRLSNVRYREIRVRVVQNDTGVSANRLWRYARLTISLLMTYGYQWRTQAVRYLIINSDDYGYAASINDATAEAFRNGVITSASIMANMPFFDDAAEKAKQQGFYDRLGLHANITEGKPLGLGYTTIVDSHGQFLTIGALIVRSLFGGVDRDEVRAEFEEQVRRCRDAGIPLMHVDSHQWSQIIPEVQWALETVAQKYRIPCMRSVRETWTLRVLWGVSPRALFNSVVVRVLRMRVPRPPSTLIEPDHYAGILLTAHAQFERAVIAVVSTLRPGVTELMCHLGNDASVDIGKRNYYGAGRAWELQALRSNTFRLALRKARAQLISYKELSELQVLEGEVPVHQETQKRHDGKDKQL